MSRSFNEAVRTVRARREALQGTVKDMRGRLSPPQLAEDALNLIDPELTLLGRFKERIQHNRLLSLAVLAGVGWLVGAPRHHDGEAFGARQAGTAPRTNMKEKKNDSGQIHGDDWSGPAGGHTEDRSPEGGPPEAVLARRSSKAQQDPGVAPLGRDPQQPRDGQRNVAEQQHAGQERPQQQPEIRQRQL